MPTLPNMNLITPAQGGDRGTWDDKINACFVQIDAHNHTSGKGVRVPVAGLNIDTDINMGSKGLTSLGRAAFAEITALTTGARTLFVSSSDHELYWRTNAGTNVKLTNGASINTSLVGGIVGDYASVGAEVAFVDANKVYTFKDQSSPTKKWARLASGPVRIYEYNSTDSVYVEHAVDATLAASYTVTWPDALPASQTLMQVTSAGLVAFSNTLDTNQSITLQNGVVAHGPRTFSVPVVYPDFILASGTINNNGAKLGCAYAVSSSGYHMLRGLMPGWRVQSVTIHNDNTPGAAITYELYVCATTGLGNVPFTLLSGSSSSALSDPTHTLGAPYATGYTIQPGDVLALKITTPGGATVEPAILTVNYDYPAP